MPQGKPILGRLPERLAQREKWAGEKMIYKMGTKKGNIFVLITGTIIVALTVIYLAWKPAAVNRAPEGATVVRAFAASEAEFEKLEVHGWERVSIKPARKEFAEQVLVSRLQKVFPGSVPDIRVKEGDRGLLLQAAQKYAPGLAVLVTLNVRSAIQGDYGKAHGGEYNGYLIVALSSTDSQFVYDSMYDILDSLMESDNCHRSTVVKGAFTGRISGIQRQNMLRSMIEEAGAREVDVLENERLVSISAYTSKIPTRLTPGGKSVNINMAARYNSVENKTFLYVGSPIITSEY